MSGTSQYLANKELLWLKGTSMGASPTLYYAPFEGDPTDAGTGGVERTVLITASGLRPVITLGAVDVPNKRCFNDAEVSLGPSVSGGFSITHGSVWDSPTPGAGNMLGSGPNPSGAYFVTASEPVVLPPGAIEIRK